jgi:hypothetical protein
MLKPLRHVALAVALSASSSALAAPPAALTPGPAARLAQSDDARFDAMLSSIDVVPPSPEALLRAFPDAPTRLAAAARERGRAAWTRLRALSMLSFFPTPATAQVLEGLTRDAADGIRAEAVLTFSRVFGRASGSAADALIAAVGRGLRDASPEVREKAVRSLRWCDDERANGLLAEARRDTALRGLVDVTAARRERRLGR